MPKALEIGARNEKRPRSAIGPASVYVFTQRFSLKIARLPVQNSLRNDSREIDFRKSTPAKHLLISSRFRSPFSDGNRIRN